MADQNPNPAPNPDQADAIEEIELEQPQNHRKAIIAVVLVLVALVAAGLWWRSTFTEDTDDAQISGHLIQVSARVNGHVVKVDVQENQLVNAGDVIAELDPSDYQIAVENAEAALANAEANAAAANVAVPITSINVGSNLRSADADVMGTRAAVEQSQKQLAAGHARVAQARANSIKAQADLERYKPLVAKDVISKQQYDAAVAAADASRAALADAVASEQAASDGVRMAHEREKQSQAMQKYAQTGPQQVQAQNARAKGALAQVKQAQAQLDQAKLNLSYTKIVAPAAGIITRKSVELNQNVASGQNLMMLVSLDDLWVTANFKETQLKHMQAGQEAEVEVDATGKTYHGKVTQVGGATGSVLSLFPPENATGNYVKVVQRVPVRIDFTDLKSEDAKHALRPGLSVEPKVRVK
ncbi:MAG: HlyD family secretion protein [Terracidiphilus sp.]|nr:HlyD family secretion protein [Terracidiphilus sp.]